MRSVSKLSLNESSEIDSNTNRFKRGQGNAFDKIGNLITDPADAGRSFVFNGDNKQVEVRGPSNELIGEYFYDGEGNRVKKHRYVSGVLTEVTVFVYSTGKLAAEYSTAPPEANPTTKWTVTDQLGSPRVLVNSLGEVVSRRDFMPFGEEITPDGTHRTSGLKYNFGDNVRQKFTGYQKDEETQLDFAEARMYQNLHARFTAVDPLLASGKSANPQTFNRYVYVINNPLILVDPTGLQAGRWYLPITSDGQPDPSRNYSYIKDGQSTDGYREVTQRNNRGELIGNGMGLDDRWVIRFNPNGPYPETFGGDQVMARFLFSDYSYQGWDFAMSDEFRATFIEQPAEGYLQGSQNVTLDLVFAGQGAAGLLKAGSTVFRPAFVSRGTADTVLLRTMKMGDDGMPVVGQQATTLGARVPKDIVSEGGIVHPGTGGMSVTPEGGVMREFGGKNLRTFCISCSDLGPNLRYVPDPKNPLNHGFIEPSKQMALEAYQEALKSTQEFWRIY